MTRPTLMIVDDSDIDRYIIRRLLQQSGEDVRIVELGDGSEALGWLQDNELSENARFCILLDLNMPVMGGFEFLQALDKLRNERPDLQQASVTVLTSSNHPEDLHRSVAFPFVNRHLVKMPTAVELGSMLADSGNTARPHA